MVEVISASCSEKVVAGLVVVSGTGISKLVRKTRAVILHVSDG